MQTRAALGGKTEVSETDFLRNMESYYEEIKNKMDTGTSESNLGFLRNLQFADLYKSFKLIDDPNFERKDIFIEIDDHAKAVWKMFLKMKSIDDPIERKNKFLEFKKDFYDYVVSVPSKYVAEEEFENLGFVYIGNDCLEQCYDIDEGWIRTDNDFRNYFF